MNQTAKVATAVVGGYVLGRTKKAKAALALGMWLAGRKMRTRPSWLVADALSKLASSEQGHQLREQLTGEVVGRGRRVVGGMLTDRLEQLADGIAERAELLATGDGHRPDGGRGGRRNRAEPEYDEADEYDAYDDEGVDDEDDEDEPRAGRSADEYDEDDYDEGEDDEESPRPRSRAGARGRARDEADGEEDDDYESDEEPDDDELGASDEYEDDEDDYDEEPEDEDDEDRELVGARASSRRGAGSRSRR